jgi:hypothetical protein
MRFGCGGLHGSFDLFGLREFDDRRRQGRRMNSTPDRRSCAKPHWSILIAQPVYAYQQINSVIVDAVLNRISLSGENVRLRAAPTLITGLFC